MQGSVLRRPWRSLRSSEWIVAIGLAYVALFVLPPVLMLLVIGAKFQGLQDVVALDHAQLARHVAAGDGFVTSILRPLALVFKAELHNPPDLYNAPAHPYLLALFFREFGASDRVTAGAGALLWVLSVWGTYGLARRWFGAGVAALAALFYACNVAAIAAAINGLPTPLASLALLVGAWFAVPGGAGEQRSGELSRGLAGADDPIAAQAGAMPPWRIVMAGAACAVATLSHYSLAVFAAALGWAIVAGEREKGRALGLFLLGFFGCAAPWAWRNLRVVGSPLFTVANYDLLANTGAYPGESIWRLAEQPDHPVVFLAHHPLQMLRKLLTGLAQFRAEAPGLLDPVVGFLFLAAFLNPTGSAPWRRLNAAVLGSMALVVIGTSLTRSEPRLLLAWTPLVAIAAARGLVDWLPELLDGLRQSERWTALRWANALGYVVPLLLVAAPLAYYVLVARPGPDPQLEARLAAVQRQLGADATVLTDQPALLAWYGSRRGLLLPQREEDLARLEQLGSIDAAYVTAALAQVPLEERGDWWLWVATPQGIYHGLAPAASMPPNAVLRLRQRGGPS